MHHYQYFLIQLKCHQYWPLEGSLTAGDIKVTVIEEDDHKEFIVRVLDLEHLKVS
jgi:hypothetical protein